MKFRRAAAEIRGAAQHRSSFRVGPFFKTHAQPERSCLGVARWGSEPRCTLLFSYYSADSPPAAARCVPRTT